MTEASFRRRGGTVVTHPFRSRCCRSPPVLGRAGGGDIHGDASLETFVVGPVSEVKGECLVQNHQKAVTGCPCVFHERDRRGLRLHVDMGERHHRKNGDVAEQNQSAKSAAAALPATSEEFDYCHIATCRPCSHYNGIGTGCQSGNCGWKKPISWN